MGGHGQAGWVGGLTLKNWVVGGGVASAGECVVVRQEKACELVPMWTQSLLFALATRQLDFSHFY
jgi:hypothetical protein